jgi:hypothetical protein
MLQNASLCGQKMHGAGIESKIENSTIRRGKPAADEKEKKE